MPSTSAWKRPPPRRLRAIRDRLRAEYCKPVQHAHRAPVDELVLTVLSQNTNDRNRDVAYERMRERFPSWQAVRDAPVEEVEDAIRPGGLAVTKAPRIQAILLALDDDDLQWMAEGPLEEAHDELLRLADPGDAYEIHASLIRHDRRTCHARSPRCGECPLLRMCPYGRERHRAA